MGFLQQFHLAINYNKGSTNKSVDIISRPPTSNITSLVTMMHMESLTHDAYKEAYTKYEDFKEVFQHLQGQIHIEEVDGNVDYHFQNGLLYKLEQLHVPKCE
jgi:hypothetical protein